LVKTNWLIANLYLDEMSYRVASQSVTTIVEYILFWHPKSNITYFISVADKYIVRFVCKWWVYTINCRVNTRCAYYIQMYIHMVQRIIHYCKKKQKKPHWLTKEREALYYSVNSPFTDKTNNILVGNWEQQELIVP
jgi:hypothetical protein